MDCWLSILIPSKRPMALDGMLRSLQDTAMSFDSIELVVLVDSAVDQRRSFKNNIVIGRQPSSPVSMSELNFTCYEASSAPWVMFCNDDTVMETAAWDEKLRDALAPYESDGVGMVWPNDGMFGERVACFPIVSRRFLDGIDFWPQPYRRYLIDNTLTEIMPPHRRMYVHDVSLRHLNDHGQDGYILPDGRVYAVDEEAAKHDLALWGQEAPRRWMMKHKIAEMMGVVA